MLGDLLDFEVEVVDEDFELGALKALVWFWIIDETLGTNLWL